jgi:hypothetical protein
MAVQWGSMGLAMVNAAKHKLVGLLAEKLKGQVYVGEVIVLGIVKGTAFDRGQGGLDPKTIGAKFWELFAARKDVVAQVGSFARRFRSREGSRVLASCCSQSNSSS